MPENSLAAFAAAAEAGYGIELDVRLTADRQPVIVHDADLRHVTGTPLRVATATAAELAPLRLGDSDEAVPHLPQALGTVAGRVPVMVEVKPTRPGDPRAEPVVAGVLDAYDGPVCVAGFDPRTIDWFRRHRPDLPRVMTGGLAAAGRLPGPVRRRLATLPRLDQLEVDAVSYELAALPAPATDRWREAGGTLVTWTATTEEELARAQRLADNVIFERVRPPLPSR